MDCVNRNEEPAIARIKTSHVMNQIGGCGNGFQGFYKAM